MQWLHGGKSREANKDDEVRSHCRFWVAGTKEGNAETGAQVWDPSVLLAPNNVSSCLNPHYRQLTKNFENAACMYQTRLQPEQLWVGEEFIKKHTAQELANSPLHQSVYYPFIQ